MPEAAFAPYLDALLRADAAAAVGAVQTVLSRGVPPARLLTDLIGRAQREVGRRWELGHLTIAEERAATAAAEQALLVVATSMRSDTGGPWVVFACTEDEWHTMPARLAAEVARASGLRVRMLGPSVPVSYLYRYLASERPAALALSTTLPANLVGAALSIDAAHRAGVPVVAGGAAWGPTDARAVALGADAKVDDPRDLAQAVAELAGRGTFRDAGVPDPEVALLGRAPRELAEAALRRHRAADAAARSLPAVQPEQSVRDLQSVMRHAAAALLCGDHSILSELLAREVATQGRRGLAAQHVVDDWHHLAHVLAASAPAGSAAVRHCADGLGHPSGG
ncbi:cobalamin B12-binding domain-containing protein [Nocardioides sp. SYSU DS0663]|uniref:cobalamin B12-binding domain-containing protein n=1 Tax=Nocardioides sp. SYSU DS0663 TaxID=3416445 RepID=UPI003F4B3E33